MRKELKNSKSLMRRRVEVGEGGSSAENIYIHQADGSI